MLGLKNAQTLVGLITIFLAYLATIAPAGFFRAWAAKKMGDDTAEDLGFMTLNPFVHIDPIGILILLLFAEPQYFSSFGWGKHIPINPHNIQGHYRWLKLSFAFFSDTIAHFVLATAALIAMSGIYGRETLTFIAQDSSYAWVIFRLLFAFIGLNLALVVVELIINGVMLAALYISENNYQFGGYIYYFIFLAPVIIIFLFATEFQYMLFRCILVIERCISHILY